MVNFAAIKAVVDELHDLVTGDPRLQDFLAEMTEVRAQAESLALGSRSIVAMPRKARRGLPDRETAERIVDILGKLPPIEPELDDPQEVRLAAQLLGNLVVALTHAVFVSYPELMRGE
jgi:hypothetical protein